MRWLDPTDQARLSGLGFSPRRPAPPSAPGRHRTLARGFTRDFAQHRPYAFGDEARAIDWKAYARLDRYYVREYRSEDRISLMILLDVTASMSFAGGGRPPKIDAARRIAAGLAWIAVAQGDEAGLMSVGGKAKILAPPRAGAAQLTALDEALTSATPTAAPDDGLAGGLEKAVESLPRRAAIAVLSDLLGDSTKILRALSRLTRGRRELMVLRILDPVERDFPFEGPLQFDGLEGGTVRVDASELATQYRAAFQRQEDVYRTTLRKASTPYASLTTDAPWTKAVSRLLSP